MTRYWTHILGKISSFCGVCVSVVIVNLVANTHSCCTFLCVHWCFHACVFTYSRCAYCHLNENSRCAETCWYREMNARALALYSAYINRWMDTVNPIFWTTVALVASVSLLECLFNLLCFTSPSILFKAISIFFPPCWAHCTGWVERRMVRVN